jgi:hypothetical protein
LNKHLYILSILSIIAKARKSIYYKLISWILKIVIAINLLITSGIFFSVVDLYTTFKGVYYFYNDILAPYIEIVYNQYNEIQSNIETKYLKNTSFKNVDSSAMQSISTIDESSFTENMPTDNENVEFKINANKIFFYSAVALFLNFIYFIPGGSTPPTEIVKYNWFNQALINVKV